MLIDRLYPPPPPDTSSWTWHAFQCYRRLALLDKPGAALRARYLLSDHLGTANVVTDDTGRVLSKYSLDPWGNVEATWETVPLRWLYTGKERDPEVGGSVSYFNARYYDSERGSFTGRDPKLQFWSPYAYVGNGALTRVDPTGEDYTINLSDGNEMQGKTYQEFVSNVNAVAADVKITKVDVWGHGNQWWQGFNTAKPQDPNGFAASAKGSYIDGPGNAQTQSLALLLKDKMAYHSEIWLRGCSVTLGSENLGKALSKDLPGVFVFGSPDKVRAIPAAILSAFGMDSYLRNRVYLNGRLVWDIQ